MEELLAELRQKCDLSRSYRLEEGDGLVREQGSLVGENGRRVFPPVWVVDPEGIQHLVLDRRSTMDVVRQRFWLLTRHIWVAPVELEALLLVGYHVEVHTKFRDLLYLDAAGIEPNITNQIGC